MTQITTKTGKNIVFRNPTMDDAQAMLEYINTLSTERTYIRFQGEQQTLEEEQQFLTGKLAAIEEKRAVTLLAFDGKTLVANSGIEMQEKIDRHIGNFGISVAREYRGEGIGRMLMDAVIEEAKKNIPELEIITLGVFSNNGKACALYESFGFTQYGVLPKGVKLNDGYVDHIYMYKRVR